MGSHLNYLLFEILDVTRDDAISRSDLHRAAQLMGWHWADVQRRYKAREPG